MAWRLNWTKIRITRGRLWLRCCCCCGVADGLTFSIDYSKWLIDYSNTPHSPISQSALKCVFIQVFKWIINAVNDYFCVSTCLLFLSEKSHSTLWSNFYSRQVKWVWNYKYTLEMLFWIVVQQVLKIDENCAIMHSSFNTKWRKSNIFSHDAPC